MHAAMKQTEQSDLLSTHRSLLTRLKNWDDKEGWKRFFDTYWKLVYNAAIRAGLSDAEAQDVVQETVLAMARKMDDFKYDPAVGSFKGWLLTLTRWRIADQFRQRARHGRQAQPPPDDTAQTPLVEKVPDPKGEELEAIWDEEWRKNLMDAAIERVKHKVGARQYQLFDLYVIKGWAVDDIVQTLGVFADQIYQAKRRISVAVRSECEQLEKKFI
jgi:RNA polymerase sigma-70 factor (ECF subfamily)